MSKTQYFNLTVQADSWEDLYSHFPKNSIVNTITDGVCTDISNSSKDDVPR